VKIGEDKSALSTAEKNFFWGEKPRKDLHHLHRGGFRWAGHAGKVQICAIFADRHAESEAK
jgi:hypothetical protein